MKYFEPLFALIGIITKSGVVYSQYEDGINMVESMKRKDAKGGHK